MVPRLFARNERVIPIFSIDNGFMAVAMVGAVNVAAIETVWSALVTPPHRSNILRVGYEDNAEPVTLKKGDHMGTFNMGSTVIVLFSKNSVATLEEVKDGMGLQMGQATHHFV